MSNAGDTTVTFDQLRGLKSLSRVAGLLSFLHEQGCARDTAGNRNLHFDDYVLLVLLYLFNPMIDSMRTLQKVADLPELRRRLGIRRSCFASVTQGTPLLLRRHHPQLLVIAPPKKSCEVLT